ncbi:SpvB/TcaC N-terminal domain-containing protein [Massilia sp. DJPM01]|uniref:SpvB/TcaC N-terminal domain-containing protein n=1 Tax=Massilia sp. DJPM01 TaxID=3024404 RepID=UPI00259F23CF|nr:SpvB/TcaC N-terminal domain-containing protein [Massilia sp. DJPM01]MDM5177476.1 SpvB/TcaC N-terminal domain-containing protein [Massilia sp. DJPM01]
MSEKFSPDLYTGTGNFSIPVPLPPGRNGFQPQLGLSFSTGHGNGAFGAGWSAGIPALSRKTSHGIPRYRDNAGASSIKPDVFMLSGAEDLVPVDGGAPGAQRYRPRTEGLFALIDRFHDAGNDYWKVQTKDGLTSFYGTPGLAGNDPAVIANPADRRKVFTWNLSCTVDPFGNRIEYAYARDQGDAGALEWDQLYLKQIRYVDYPDSAGQLHYLVHVDFLYDNDVPPPGASAARERPDPFSEGRAGFQIRTRRRCKWIVVKTRPVPAREQLVRALELIYLDERTDLPDLPERLPLNAMSLMSLIDVIGYDDDNRPARELPPVEFTYSSFEPRQRKFAAVTGQNLPPVSLANPDIALVDLSGNGLPDLFEMGDSVRYWRNLGGGQFDLPRAMPDAPAGLRLSDRGVQLIDANGDGRSDLLVTNAELSGYYAATFQGAWDRKKSFQRYRQAPGFDLEDPEVHLVDLDGDGVTDAIRAATRLECYFNDPLQGWQPGTDHVRFVERRPDGFPASFSDPRVRWADMTGDGMQDVVLVHNARIDYWPNLGYGEFGPRVHMRNAPHLPLDYDPRRLLIGDVDGDGIADIVYIEQGRLTLWINQCGNGWSAPVVIHGTPQVSDIDSVRLVDLLGTGVSGVLWTQDARGGSRDRYFFLDFTGAAKPYLLTGMNNHIGAVTSVEYASSTREYVRDQADRATAWRTPLPFPVQVVTRVEVLDQISQGKLTTEYRYHHGYWDGAEREFRGFGMVEQIDTVSFATYNAAGLHGAAAFFASVERRFFSAPTLTRTWFHQGPAGAESGDWPERDFTSEYWPGDPQLLKHSAAVDAFTSTLPHRRAKRDALRALRGRILRSELFALDGSALEERPYTVTEHAYGLREEPAAGGPAPARARVFFAHSTAQRTTQWERGDDPLTTFSFSSQYDDYGQPLIHSALAMPRRSLKRLPQRENSPTDQAAVLATHTCSAYAAQATSPASRICNRIARSTGFALVPAARVVETQPADVLAVLRDHMQLAEALHRQFEASLTSWQPEQGNPAGYRIIAHALSYYDGAAYQGEALGLAGRYGALTRSESLVVTDAILDRVYHVGGTTRRPAYLGGTAASPSGAPAGFGADHGYLDKRNHVAGYVPGYYASTGQHTFDFQDGAANPRGLPVAMRDALDHETRIERYDDFLFLPLQLRDARGMSVTAEYNLRVLRPRKVIDPNGNVSEVAFSPAGFVTDTWVKGKHGEGDGSSSGSRRSYDFLAFQRSGQPIHTRTIQRVYHDTDPDDTGETIESRDYSDGFGRVIQTRKQGASVRFGDGILSPDQNEAHGAPLTATVNADVDRPNVLVSGWQVYDNKGKPVEKYEPFFSQGWAYEAQADAQRGVHAQMYYDPRGQVIRTVNPDGSERRVLFGVPASLDDPFNFIPTPWEAYTYDPNDNAGRTHAGDSAALRYRHHWNTPSSIMIDALGRTVGAVARHRPTALAAIEEHLTVSAYDVQGDVLLIIDPLGRYAFEYAYDLARHALRTENIDAGTSQVVFNALGSAIESMDAKGACSLRRYDELNRPLGLWARDSAADALTLREKCLYGDDPSLAASAEHNLLGRLYRHHDEAGVITIADYDFKGNVLASRRSVLSDDFMLANLRAQTGTAWDLSAPRVDWNGAPAGMLDAAEYRTRNAYDAMNRIKWSDYPQAANGERYRLRPGYDRAGALERVDLEGPLGANDAGARQTYVQRLAYNARGQRTFIAYGNGKIKRYAYDPATFGLLRMRTEGYTRASDLAYQPGGAVLQDLAYQYDLGGNIVRTTDRTPGCGVRNNPRALLYPALQTLLAAGDALVREFTYDPLYRLASASGRESSAISVPRAASDDARAGFNSGNHGSPDQDNAPDMTSLYDEDYAYDAAGNMLKLIHRRDGASVWSRHFGMAGFNPAQWNDKIAQAAGGIAPDWGSGGNRLTHFGNEAAAALSHAFDANGNMTQEHAERHADWDHADRMKAFRIQAGASGPSLYALYLYDSAGMRVKKLVWKSGSYTTTTYLGETFEQHREVKPGGIRENNHVHVMDGASRIAIERIGDAFDGDGASGHPVQYHFGDHAGSSTVVVGGSGVWINREEFFPYGETSFGSFGKKRYRYAGKERDEESGLNRNGVRYLSGALARWISCDPAGPIDGLNLYVFARCSPITLSDANGYAAGDVNLEAAVTAERAGTEILVKKYSKVAPTTDITPQGKCLTENGVDTHLVVGKDKAAVNVMGEVKHSQAPERTGTSKSFRGKETGAGISSFDSAAKNDYGQLVTNIRAARANSTLDPSTAYHAIEGAKAGEVIPEVVLSGDNLRLNETTRSRYQANVTAGDQFADAVKHDDSLKVSRSLRGPRGQANLGATLSMAGITMTVVALIQTKLSFDAAYAESVQTGSQRPLEDEAIRQAGAWGAGLAAGVVFSFAIKGTLLGGAAGPGGAALGFFVGLAVGGAAAWIGGKAAQAGIDSGAVDGMRGIFQP